MKTFATHWERLEETVHGGILMISFGGAYPIGSMGNEAASSMKQYVKEIVAAENPAAVLFNLTRLDYEFGDAIMGIVKPLIDADRNVRPICIHAAGNTALALAPFFGPGFLWGVLGIASCDTRAEGIEKLNKMLAQSEEDGGSR
ncbi:MAG: hypothetical protein HKN20_13970 [Gemmatimonadetes bacterium]|nr:hypothetical protein [Gemmatimonadota bacterium]